MDRTTDRAWDLGYRRMEIGRGFARIGLLATRVSVIALLLLVSCSTRRAALLPGVTCASVSMPASAMVTHDSRLLGRVGERPLEPVAQADGRAYAYRCLLFARGRIVLFELSGRYWESVSPEELIMFRDAVFRVSRYRAEDGAVEHAEEGVWQREEVNEWFELLMRSELFSLPPRRAIRDDGVSYESRGSPPLFYAERSRFGEYTLIERAAPSQVSPPARILEWLNARFPDAGFW